MRDLDEQMLNTTDSKHVYRTNAPIITTRAVTVQRGGMFSVVSVGVWVCLSVCQNDISWTVWDIIMKFLQEQDMVKRLDESKNSCIPIQRVGSD